MKTKLPDEKIMERIKEVQIVHKLNLDTAPTYLQMGHNLATNIRNRGGEKYLKSLGFKMQYNNPRHKWNDKNILAEIRKVQKECGLAPNALPKFPQMSIALTSAICNRGGKLYMDKLINPKVEVVSEVKKSEEISKTKESVREKKSRLKTKNKAPKLSIDDIAVVARSMGLTYGQYVAMG